MGWTVGPTGHAAAEKEIPEAVASRWEQPAGRRGLTSVP